MSCVKCGIQFTSAEKLTAIRCVKCEGLYHVKCSGLGTTTRAQKSEFKCDKCKDVSVSTLPNSSSTEDQGKQTIIKAINDLKADLIAVVDSKLKKLEETMIKNLDVKFHAVYDKIEEVSKNLNSSISELKVENQQLRAKCEQLEVKCEEVTQEVLKLKEDMLDMQQYSRVQNLEVTGVPLTEGEDVYAVLEGIAKIIQVPYNRQEFSIAHRLGREGKKQQPPNIVVRFVSRTTRAAWLQAARGVDINAAQLNPTLRPGRVYVNEHLLPYTKLLLSKAKAAVRSERIAYSWIRDGKLFVRKTENGKPQRIKNLRDLESVVGDRK